MDMDPADSVQDAGTEQDGPRPDGTQDEEMLRDLGNRKSEERIIFDGPMPRSVQFLREDGSLIPATPFIKDKGSDIRLSVISCPVAAKLRLKVILVHHIISNASPRPDPAKAPTEFKEWQET
ncbi:hypothetical protein Plec18167_001578 [Paecilomyces lecythidis]|uniref:Uncharacterized protein n=1 Tax=Paecilomyces lecythidis TaxID=3004212 RepID=A0ABR3YAV9_9EURO